MGRPARNNDRAQFAQRLPGRRLIPVLLVPILALGAVSIARANLSPARLAMGLNAGVTAVEPTELMVAAAAALEDATRPGGPGYRFEIVQTSTMVAKPDGPKIPIPNAIGPVRQRGVRTVDGNPVGTRVGFLWDRMSPEMESERR